MTPLPLRPRLRLFVFKLDRSDGRQNDQHLSRATPVVVVAALPLYPRRARLRVYYQNCHDRRQSPWLGLKR